MTQVKIFTFSEIEEFNKFVRENSEKGMATSIKNTDNHIIVFYEETRSMVGTKIVELKDELKKHLTLAMTYEVQLREALKFRDSYEIATPRWSEIGQVAYNHSKMLESEVRKCESCKDLLDSFGVNIELPKIDLMDKEVNVEISETKAVESPLYPKKKK